MVSKKIYFKVSYLVERQHQLQQLQKKSGSEANSNQEIKKEDKETNLSAKKNSSRNKRSRRSENTSKSRRQRLTNQPTESSVASSSLQTNPAKSNSSDIAQYLSSLYNTNNKAKLDQIFSTNSLFNSSQSLLTKLDLKVLFQPAIFESLPRQSQLKLIKLLPECDRLFDSHGSFK